MKDFEDNVHRTGSKTSIAWSIRHIAPEKAWHLAPSFKVSRALVR